MGNEITGVAVVFGLAATLSWPLGRYISGVFRGTSGRFKVFTVPERLIFRFCKIDPSAGMDWKQNMKAMLSANVLFFFAAFFLLLLQGIIPFWNPGRLAGWDPIPAFNAAVSFVTNTNLQHYAGETDAAYFTQLVVFCWLQFVSAGTGIAVCGLLFQGLSGDTGSNIGNFYSLLVRSCVRILLPLAVILSAGLTLCGTVSDFGGVREVHTLENRMQQVAGGPAAPMIAIKQLGTNGGGFFGANSAHPFENPDYLSNMLENIAILLLPMALVFAFGFYLKRKRAAILFFSIMTTLFLAFTAVSVGQEVTGGASVPESGLLPGPNLEGKEMRFGPVASAFWAVSTTSTSNGSVNSMHDSHTALSGGVLLLDMFINALYGGVGVGFINFFVFVVVAVFISGQMIGRTPDLFGKKLEAREIKIAALVVILHPLLILCGTAAACLASSRQGWLNNPGFHGFSEMMYEFTSAAANNGSGFEGLHDNTPFWNLATGVIMLFGRFLPIIGPLAIAGALSVKKAVPASSGSLKIESMAFGAVLTAVILIVAALAFFPALALGPVAEYFSTL
ncbi:MAG: potassium-transporting ATPase subunit A [Lewinellaceae bacterium]|nr:potassium-transporting ATPase subunit A [Lewinellaceae bacterium]